MANSESEEETQDIIPWTEELGEENLSELERKLEQETRIDFEDSDFEKKGVSEQNGKNFYFGLTETVELFEDDVEVTIKKEDSTYRVEYWSNTPEVLELFREYISDFIEENDGGVLLEPYKIEDLTDVELSYILDTLEQDLDVEGPLPRSGKGNAKRYPVLADNLDTKGVDGYSTKAFSVLGDGMYEIDGLVNGPSEIDVEGKVIIMPQKRDNGLYKVKAKGKDMESTGYIVDTILKGSQKFRSEKNTE